MSDPTCETADAEAPIAVPRGTRDDPDARQALADLRITGSAIGRYVILEHVGAGAMGVVYAAYDPELDRKVALKLLRRSQGLDSAAQTRLLREAQALARVSHPNVVSVHDVGTHDGGVFVAMEFVAGVTLAEWTKAEPRPWEDVLQLYQAAARGLVAVHAEGLVHRDFKPYNVMIGDDGRVRVMDFGLARTQSDSGPSGEVDVKAALTRAASLANSRVSQSDVLSRPLTRTGALMGTPAYMAPEQMLGVEITASADQFAFCVSLYEALYGARPFAGASIDAMVLARETGEIAAPPKDSRVPLWLRRAVVRGLASHPDERYRDMNALLEALDAGLARPRRVRRTVVVIGVALLAAALPATRWLAQSRAEQQCADQGATIEVVWNDQTRARLREGIVASGHPNARDVADRVTPWLDRHAQQWRDAKAAACHNANVDERWDAAQLDRATWCLDARRLELVALVERMADADERAARNAVQAASSLGPVPSCVDEASLARMPDPPARDEQPALEAIRSALADARYLKSTGDYEGALERATAARELAQAADAPVLTARAAVMQGRALLDTGAVAQSEAALRSAYLEAASAEAWATAAHAASELVFVVGYHLERHDDGQLWADLAKVAIEHAGDPLELREATRASYVGHLYDSAGDYRAAEQWHRKAVDIERRALGEHPRVAAGLTGLGNVLFRLGRIDEAIETEQRALAIKEAAEGPAHPNVATSLHNLANNLYKVGELEEAARLYERSLAIKEATSGSVSPTVAKTLSNLAAVRRGLGDAERAYDEMLRAAEIFEASLGPRTPTVAMVKTNIADLLLDLERADEAIAVADEARAILKEALPADHPHVAYTMQVLGVALAGLGRTDEAIAALQDAVRIRTSEQVAPDLLATSQFALAKALWASDEALRPRAVQLAERAHETFAEQTTNPERLADVEAWLAEHR